MLQRVAKNISQSVFALLGLVLISWGFVFLSPLAQDTSSGSMSDYFQRLKDSDIPAYIRFIEPIDGIYVGWDVPTDLETEVGVTGSRYISEVGTDYLCITEIGAGLQNVYCIPFSNIAHVVQPTLP